MKSNKMTNPGYMILCTIILFYLVYKFILYFVAKW